MNELYNLILAHWSFFTSFLLCSFATGWVLIARVAQCQGRVDLCTFVNRFIASPFVTILSWGAGLVIYGVTVVLIIPNILKILAVIVGVVVTGILMFLLGSFLVAPAVKTSMKIAKPFTSKLCVVMYDKDAIRRKELNKQLQEQKAQHEKTTNRI